MLNLEQGVVKNIILQRDGVQFLEVEVNEKCEVALNYINHTGICRTGDRVVLNTIALRMSLGTGGYHFVYYNLSNKNNDVDFNKSSGHIIKMKYTPYQFKVKTIEEVDIFKKYFDSPVDLSSKKILIAKLHSMIAPGACVLKYKQSDCKISFIYCYGGSLEAKFSNTLSELKEKKIIDNVITCGECYGGDYESVNIFTAIIFAFKILRSDYVIISCGPGIAGTSTFYGFSSLELVFAAYAVNLMGNVPIVIPRVSFADKRDRHYGISLQSIAFLKCINFPVYFPLYSSIGGEIISKQIKTHDIFLKHHVRYINNSCVREAMAYYKVNGVSMGRRYDDDPAYFENCGAASEFALI
ncbi:hypothetical protein Q428_13295 [Fervidicella metallireducens AeB]|uniref:DUF3866 domain-containing protein n=1 Tax=Fervidicella metallireducens AeB TaxID=1403537 RepID=A0A017RRQ6_9CLOT|nr:DUF3866 family protein [Fervidicella metallireducens]EYE87443.1 hypothetical protein Q428_13295 [Fervidicella metallireducens AeB]